MEDRVAAAFAGDRTVLVGIGLAGWDGLAQFGRDVLTAADVIVGSPRQLQLLPPDLTAQRRTWGAAEAGVPVGAVGAVGSLGSVVREVSGRRVVVLASGDPLHYGIGRALVEQLGAEHVVVVPHVSSVSLACARLGWPVEDVRVVGGVGRDPGQLDRRLAHLLGDGRQLLILGATREGPATVAESLCRHGFGISTMTVLSDLDGREETRSDASAATWSGDAPSIRHVIAVDCRRDPGAPRATPMPPAGPVEDLGPEAMAVLTGLMAPRPGEVLWQIGGAGGAALAWLSMQPGTSACALLVSPDLVQAALQRAAGLGAGRLVARVGRPPGGLAGLTTPDVILVTGGLHANGLIPTCWARLRPGGRLVCVASTVESEALLARYRRHMGGTLRRIGVEHARDQGDAAPAQGSTVWVARTPVTVWDVDKPVDASPAPALAHPGGTGDGEVPGAAPEPIEPDVT